MDVKYRWPSTVNVANYITARPDLPRKGQKANDDFYIWKELMVCLLESQGVVGFVNGEIVKPDAQSAERQWRRTDRLVKGWILGSIGRDTLGLVWRSETARDVWLELDKIFSVKPVETGRTDETGEDRSRYLPLYKAALNGDWETAKTEFFDRDDEAATAIIAPYDETALHAAASTGKANEFVAKLVELMPSEAILRQDVYGFTALHRVAIAGNTEAAIELVNKNPDSLYILDKGKQLPVHLAAAAGKKETLEYLLSVCDPDGDNSPFQGQLGIELLKRVITSGFFDVALVLARTYPDLASLRRDEINCALSDLAGRENAFASRESFSWWQYLIYHCIPVKQTVSATQRGARDIESARDDRCSSSFEGGKVAKKFGTIIRNVIEHLVPQVKDIREKKVRHSQANELVKYLCRKMLSLPQNDAMDLFGFSIFVAATNGISEIVEAVLDMYPPSYYVTDKTGKNIFQIAASLRFENIFNLVYTMSDRNYQIPNHVDKHGNNLLHICAKLAPPRRLNLVPGAALQMQRELQWFNEMEKFVSPAHKTFANKEFKTPNMIFTEEHRELKAQGERWMKDTANACTLAAALIATVVFAAAFTVPGGVASETGIPIFSKEIAFALFTISDAVSLFTSITSLLMFLSIVTSRYAEEDFLHVLPKRLSIGLLCLFVSIAFMIVAFSATLYLVTRGNLAWFITPVTALACLPVTSFVLLQFPLLLDVIYSTYGPGIFGKKK